MSEGRRYLRYLVPGLSFFALFLLYCELLKPGTFNSWSGTEHATAKVLACTLGSGFSGISCTCCITYFNNWFTHVALLLT